jgi:hypothetical protein
MLFAIAGNAGQAILFILSLAAWAIAAGWLIAYAAHCYLVVTQTTAAGLDKVEWPDDPVTDWLPRSVFLVGLLLLWLAPVGILCRALRHDFLPDDGGLRFLILAVPGVWLLFPVGLLSSLASSSRWETVSPTVLGKMLRIFPSVLLFYLCTAPLFAAASALVWVGLFTPVWYALPLASAGGSAVLLIHARLVGRLAWLMGETENKPTAKKKPKSGAGKRTKAARPPRARASHDPWAAPAAEEEESHEETPPAPGYRVVEQDKEEPRPARPSYLDPEPEPYVMADPAPEPEAAPPAERLNLDKGRVEQELALRTRTPPNPPPAIPLVSGVYTFPFYPTSAKAWVWLGLSGLVTGVFWRMMMQFWPGG